MTQTNLPDTLVLIRIRLAERVQRTSLRHVAREVGMSPSGLSKVIEDGTTLYRKTIDRLLVWWANQPKTADQSVEEIRRLGIEMATASLTGELGRRAAKILGELLTDVTPSRLDAVETALRLHEQTRSRNAGIRYVDD